MRHGDVVQAHAVGVVEQPFAEFAGGDYRAGRVEAGQLGRHHVVGQSARSDHHRAVVGAGQFAQAAADAEHQLAELGRAMGQRRLLECLNHRVGHCHRAGGEDDGIIGWRGDGFVELAGELRAHVAHGPVHGLVGSGFVAHHRAEGDEPDVAVQGLLGYAAGHHHVVVAAILAVAGHHGEEAGEHAGAAQFGPHGQQAHLAELGAGGLGQVILQAAEFLVQGERPTVAHADHAQQFRPAPADEVGVFVVELVHQRAVVVGGMLGHLLDEGGVVQLGNLGEFPGLGGRLEHQAGGRCMSRHFRHQRLAGLSQTGMSAPPKLQRYRLARKLQLPALAHYTNRANPAIHNMAARLPQ